MDLNSRVWTQIAPLPLASYWNTGTVVEKSIYLTGFFIGGLLNYSESLNTYTQICELPENTCKLVLGNWALVSDSNEVLEIKNGVVKNWRMAMPWHGYYLLYSCTFRRGKWIYFVEGHLNEKKGIFLRRFDVIEKKIEDLEYIE